MSSWTSEGSEYEQELKIFGAATGFIIVAGNFIQPCSYTISDARLNPLLEDDSESNNRIYGTYLVLS